MTPCHIVLIAMQRIEDKSLLETLGIFIKAKAFIVDFLQRQTYFYQENVSPMELAQDF